MGERRVVAKPADGGKATTVDTGRGSSKSRLKHHPGPLRGYFNQPNLYPCGGARICEVALPKLERSIPSPYLAPWVANRRRLRLATLEAKGATVISIRRLSAVAIL